MPKLNITNTFSANTQIKSAQTNQNFSDVMAFSGSRLYHSVAQSINTATWSNIAWDTEDFDTDNYHSLVSNNHRITVPQTGYYRIHATITWASNATGFRVSRLDLNAAPTVIAFGDSQNACNGNNHISQIDTIKYLTAADYIVLSVYQNSGVALDISAGIDSTYYEIEFLGA